MTHPTHPAVSASRRFDRVLAQQMGRRDNRIDHLRLVAALAVVLGHSWHIALGRSAQVPLEEWTLFGFHSLAVHVFFFLSGLLVTESARRHVAAPTRYLCKRALRIFPALIVNAVVVPVVLVGVGAWTGVGLADMARYALRLVTLFSVQYEHPGAFADMPFHGAINGSVWSLRHEIIVYGVLMLAGLSGALTKPTRRAVFLGLLLAFVLVGHLVAPHAQGGWLYLVAEGRYVMFSFLLGVAAHQFAGWIPLHPVVVLPGIALVLAGDALASRVMAECGVIVITCAATLLLAYPRRAVWQLPHDVSYGVYIYSWPIQQLTVFLAATAFGMSLTPVGLFLLCLGPLLVVSLASWLWVERPALAIMDATWVRTASDRVSSTFSPGRRMI